MYCQHCGAEIKEGQKFCQSCGAPVKETATQSAENTEELRQEENSDKKVSEEQTEKKRRNMMPVIIAAVIVVAVIIAVCVFMFTSKSSPLRSTIDLNTYTEVKFSGYDGYGSAAVSIDYDEIVSDYGESVRIRTEEAGSFMDILKESISVSLNDTEELANGDTVTVSYTVDDAYLDETLNCNFTYEDQTYTAEGLKEVEGVDVFESVDLSYSDMAPFGQASLHGEAQYIEYGSYEINPNSDLSNGDEVTVTFEIGDTMEFLNAYGGLPSVTEKTFTVSGLDSYVMDIKELSDEDYNTLKQDAMNQAKARVDSMSFSDIRSVITDRMITPTGGTVGSDYTLDNVYFLTIKSSTEQEREAGNIEVSVPIFVYSVDVHIDALYGYTADGPMYISVSYPHLVRKEDGTLTGLDDFGTYTHRSLDQAYSEWIDNNERNYNAVVYDSDLNEVN